MKNVFTRMLPTLGAVSVSLIGYTIGFDELKMGALTCAGIFVIAAVFFDWPGTGER